MCACVRLCVHVLKVMEPGGPTPPSRIARWGGRVCGNRCSGSPAAARMDEAAAPGASALSVTAPGKHPGKQAWIPFQVKSKRKAARGVQQWNVCLQPRAVSLLFAFISWLTAFPVLQPHGLPFCPSIMSTLFPS